MHDIKTLKNKLDSLDGRIGRLAQLGGLTDRDRVKVESQVLDMAEQTERLERQLTKKLSKIEQRLLGESPQVALV